MAGSSPPRRRGQDSAGPGRWATALGSGRAASRRWSSSPRSRARCWSARGQGWRGRCSARGGSVPRRRAFGRWRIRSPRPTAAPPDTRPPPPFVGSTWTCSWLTSALHLPPFAACPAPALSTFPRRRSESEVECSVGMDTAVHDLIGQRFVIDFSGPEVTADLERLIREGRVGGVILFVKNIRSVSQVRGLTADLQRLAADAGLPPLLITIDQDGGLVNRLIDGITIFPSAMAIGASGRAEDAATAGRITSMELRALGVNTNHAPVLDGNSNMENPIIGISSFGDDPAQVARLGIAYIRAAQAAGILTTAKHFPGHGATPVDSHLDLPVVTKDLQRLRREEVFPFAEAIGAGVDGIMSTHIVFPALDADRPASLSPQIMTGLLREELGF